MSKMNGSGYSSTARVTGSAPSCIATLLAKQISLMTSYNGMKTSSHFSPKKPSA
jgi:hypothetical protein